MTSSILISSRGSFSKSSNKLLVKLIAFCKESLLLALRAPIDETHGDNGDTNSPAVEGFCVVFDGKYFVVDESVDGVDNDAFDCGVSDFDDNNDRSNIAGDVAVVDKYVVVDVDGTDDS